MIADEFAVRTNELIALGLWADTKGWVPATSGNFSARLSDNSIAITVSGKHKGQLQTNDIMRVNAQGESLDCRRSSAETLLHTQIYQHYADVHAVLHPHSPASTLISQLEADHITLKNLELLKALSGIETHETVVHIPVFANDQNMNRLSSLVERYMTSHTGPLHAYLIAGHGFYTWGNSIAAAARQMEALEFMFDLTLRQKGLQP